MTVSTADSHTKNLAKCYQAFSFHFRFSSTVNRNPTPRQLLQAEKETKLNPFFLFPFSNSNPTLISPFTFASLSDGIRLRPFFFKVPFLYEL
jgi:hypothetical protein